MRWQGPIILTEPPACLMRCSSLLSSGLWSSESSTALPARQSTALESPQLATVTVRLPPEVSISAMMAVLPTRLKAFLWPPVASRCLAMMPKGLDSWSRPFFPFEFKPLPSCRKNASMAIMLMDRDFPDRPPSASVPREASVPLFATCLSESGGSFRSRSWMVLREAPGSSASSSCEASALSLSESRNLLAQTCSTFGNSLEAM
mmetsp:Transcript_62232/g.116474  ORF Transcript_62232/g.116474 Transcript_62232/m.116474 type:complete len:204 (-) Transcript_62232:471-1082(-)